ncbi:hypothetical protein BpHYR1_039809, partial [Brachionus plicatilis]
SIVNYSIAISEEILYIQNYEHPLDKNSSPEKRSQMNQDQGVLFSWFSNKAIWSIKNGLHYKIARKISKLKIKKGLINVTLNYSAFLTTIEPNVQIDFSATEAVMKILYNIFTKRTL